MRGSPNVFYLCYTFYILLTSNQNTKNMFVFSFINLFRRKLLIKNIKHQFLSSNMIHLDKVKVWSTSDLLITVKSQLIKSFPRFLIIYFSRDSKVHVFISMPSLTMQELSQSCNHPANRAFLSLLHWSNRFALRSNRLH